MVLTIRKKISKFDVMHLNDGKHPYTDACKASVLTLQWFRSKIDEDTCAKLGALVAPSNNAAKIAYETLGIKPKVIYHGVDTSLFNTQITKAKARETLRLPQGRKVILWNGRLDVIKDPKTLIDAIPIIAKEIPDCLFVIKARTNRSDII